MTRNYQSDTIQPATATLFVVNADGWALTCAHVAKQLALPSQIKQSFDAFKSEAAAANKKTLKALEKKYHLTKTATVDMRNLFFNCVQGTLTVDPVKFHPTQDVALLKIGGGKLLVDEFPVFARDAAELEPGNFLCRLGFPFPEFTNFAYNVTSDTIEWNDSGRKNTPRFPIEGMVTRNVIDPNSNEILGFEMSTPGLRGQSGGPAFDTDGKVWGMQSSTRHYDLDFDVDLEVMRNGVPAKVKDSAILHVGRCVHVGVLTAFMTDQGVHFDQA